MPVFLRALARVPKRTRRGGCSKARHFRLTTATQMTVVVRYKHGSSDFGCRGWPCGGGRVLQV